MNIEQPPFPCASLAKELEEEEGRREQLSEPLQIRKPGRNGEEKFRQQVKHWKELSLGFLPEIYALRRAIDSINQQYATEVPLYSAVARAAFRFTLMVTKWAHRYR